MQTRRNFLASLPVLALPLLASNKAEASATLAAPKAPKDYYLSRFPLSSRKIPSGKTEFGIFIDEFYVNITVLLKKNEPHLVLDNKCLSIHVSRVEEGNGMRLPTKVEGLYALIQEDLDPATIKVGNS